MLHCVLLEGSTIMDGHGYIFRNRQALSPIYNAGSVDVCIFGPGRVTSDGCCISDFLCIYAGSECHEYHDSSK